ncbi:cytochrome d ubiquinol oxidase subunit II [Streptomonospora wellingtoniae]|uniref:Cytochrome d ubiquinol oxidase subunit II n=1 Tax=Streptomonospora wellingtoniae TaxID=3075544 RepID=A0ABU2L1C3_9ACTN|nr:cytochrome d ubiquinol oxidase subunit II [Streptomonospora sp. DSM 45055]MDT0305182.1 cytochrome d ubiquinol oxidase subunit II [Streptomonospora sp. DSM 45055]
MSILWLVLVAAVFCGYFVLEGAVIGLGVLHPVLGRSPGERARTVTALGPLMLAGEVWLVALVGLLFGVYPQVEGDVLTGLHPIVVALLVAWLLRDAGVWFRRLSGGPRRQWACDALITAGSLGLALAWGLAFARYLTGAEGAAATRAGAVLGAVIAALLAVHAAALTARRLPRAAEAVRRLGRLGHPAVTAALVTLASLGTTGSFAPHLLDNTAPAATLAAMSWVILPIVPFVAGAQWWAWRLFLRPAPPSDVPAFF